MAQEERSTQQQVWFRAVGSTLQLFAVEQRLGSLAGAVYDTVVCAAEVSVVLLLHVLPGTCVFIYVYTCSVCCVKAVLIHNCS